MLVKDLKYPHLVKFHFGGTKDNMNHKKFIINSTHDQQTLYAAYKKSVLETGFNIEDVCDQFEETEYGEANHLRMKFLGLIREDFDPESDWHCWDEFFKVVMGFIQLSLPDFQWEEVKLNEFPAPFAYGMNC